MLLYEKLVGKLFEKKENVQALEFKHVIASRFPFKVNKTNEWFVLAKELDRMGYAKLKRTRKGFVLEKVEQKPPASVPTGF